MTPAFGTNEVGATIQPCPHRKTPVYWIEIEMVGEDGSPIPWTQYRITLPSGEIVRGYLDGRGFSRIDLIRQSGPCKVVFPELDKEAWSFIESRGAKGGT